MIMEHKQSKNDHLKFLCCILIVFWLSGCASVSTYKPANSISEIYTVVKRKPVASTKQYTSDRPVYVQGYGLNPPVYANIATFLQKVGVPTTLNKESAGHVMKMVCYVTMPYQDGRAVPFECDFLLGMSNELPLIKPLLTSSFSAEKEIMAMEKIVRASGESIGKDTGIAVSAGHAAGGDLFGLAAAATLAVADTTLSIRANNKIQEGLVGVRLITSGNSLDISVASTKEEHPVDLIKAAIERAAIELGVRK
jgi:hypothetical protein